MLTLEEILDAVRVVGVDGEVLELGGELGEVGVVVLAGVVVVAVAVAGQGGVDVVRDGSMAAPVLLLLDKLPDAEAPGVILLLLRIVTASHRSLGLPRVAVVGVCPLSGVAIAGAGPRLEVAGEPARVVPVIVTVGHIGGL